MKIVCIGNSNVNGYPHRRSECWVSLFREKLEKAGTPAKVINKGANGDTSNGILSRFENDAIKHNPEIIIVLTGTNDFMQEGKPETVLENLKQMNNIAKENGSKTVFLTPLLTDPKIAPHEWIEEVDYAELNEDLKRLSALLLAQDDLSIIDLQSQYSGGYVDGVHPDKDGHKEIAEIIFTQFRKQANRVIII